MTAGTGLDSSESAGRAPHPRLVGRWLLLLGTPLLLAVALWFHPRAGDDPSATLLPVVNTWFVVHALLLPLFGLLGIALYVLLRDYRGPVATVGRVGTAVYLVCYLAFEAIAGIATAVLLRESRDLPAAQREGVQAAVDVVFTNPVDGVAGVLALFGTVGNLVAVLAIAILLRRSGAPAAPLALLAGAPIGLVVHGSNPWDSVGMAAFCLGLAWLEWGRSTHDDPRSGA